MSVHATTPEGANPSARLRVSEVFGPTIQGEGAQIGRPTVFVRTFGCDYRCTWCDTPHAVLPQYRSESRLMTVSEVLARVEHLTAGRPILVTLSGGNPALVAPLADLVLLGQQRGHTFTMETQGSVTTWWLALLDHLCVSPKPPSSGMETDHEVLRAVLAAGPRDTVLKCVVFDEADYAYARDVAARHPGRRMYLSVGNPYPTPASGPITDSELRAVLLSRLAWLTELVVRDGWYEATVLPQLHSLLWGNLRGV